MSQYINAVDRACCMALHHACIVTQQCQSLVRKAGHEQNLHQTPDRDIWPAAISACRTTSTGQKLGIEHPPVWNVSLLCSQGADDISQSRQRLVDGLRLLQLLSSGPTLLHPAHQHYFDAAQSLRPMRQEN